MDQNDTIQIGPYKYTVLKRKHNRVLVAWTESTGIEREMWFILKKSNVNLQKAA